MSDSLRRHLLPIASDTVGPEYRLVVGATKHGSKSYVWAIVRDDDIARRAVRQSVDPFRSLEDAHAAGSVVLREFRSEEARSAKR
jgi:hypothetical protein